MVRERGKKEKKGNNKMDHRVIKAIDDNYQYILVKIVICQLTLFGLRIVRLCLIGEPPGEMELLLGGDS